MRNVAIIILIFLMLPGTSATTVPDFSQTLIPLEISSSVAFKPTDKQENPEIFNGTTIYPSTTRKRIWIGSLPLIKGELRSEDKVFEWPPVLNGTAEIEIIELDQEAEIWIAAAYTIQSKDKYSQITWTSKATVNLLNASQVHEGETKSSVFTNKIGFSASDIGNGSYVTTYSYQYLTEFDTSAIFSSWIEVYFKVSNSTWQQNANVKVTVKTDHNPAFDTYMEERYELLFGNKTSTGKNTTFPAIYAVILLGGVRRKSLRRIQLLLGKRPQS